MDSADAVIDVARRFDGQSCPKAAAVVDKLSEKLPLLTASASELVAVEYTSDGSVSENRLMGKTISNETTAVDPIRIISFPGFAISTPDCLNNFLESKNSTPAN